MNNFDLTELKNLLNEKANDKNLKNVINLYEALLNNKTKILEMTIENDCFPKPIVIKISNKSLNNSFSARLYNRNPIDIFQLDGWSLPFPLNQLWESAIGYESLKCDSIYSISANGKIIYQRGEE